MVERQLLGPSGAPGELEQVQRHLHLIQSETLRCGNIVRNLLSFARHSGSEMRLASINDIIGRSLMLVRHRLEIASIELVHEPMPGDDSVVCDPDQIQQALVALLINAAEAVEGREQQTLTVRASSDGDSAVIGVADTGPGIPENLLPQIFEPFVSTKEEQSGVGLGLAVVYGIVERHGGRLDVQTVLGTGTTFTVHLPRGGPDANESTPGNEHSGAGR